MRRRDRVCRSPPTRASPTPTRRGAAVTLGACDLATVKLAKVGGLARGARDRRARSPSTSRAPSTARSGSPPPPTRPRRCARPATPGVAHGLATQRLFAETIAAVGCELRDGVLHLPDGPGLGVELDELPCSVSGSLSRAEPDDARLPGRSVRTVDPTNRNTALASALVEELARCGVRRAVALPRLALDPARARALARAGDRGHASSSTSAGPASSRSAPPRRPAPRSRSSAPRARRPPTSTPRSARPTRRRCR